MGGTKKVLLIASVFIFIFVLAFVFQNRVGVSEGFKIQKSFTDGSKIVGVSPPIKPGDVRDRLPDLSWIDRLPDRGEVTTPFDIPISLSLDDAGSEFTDKRLAVLAVNYPVLGDHFATLSLEQIKTLRKINPNIIILRYMSAAAGYQVIDNKFKLAHPEIFLKNPDGSLHRGLLSPDDELVIDPANGFWRETLANAAREAVATEGYDGVMIDQLVMVNRLYNGFNGVNLATGNAYTTEEWRDAMYDLLAEVKQAMGPDALLVGNSIRDGPGYYAEGAGRFLAVLDGVVAEGYKGPLSRDTLFYPKESEWIKNVDVLVDVQSQGKYFLAIAKYDKNRVTSQEDLSQHVMFTLATFMLGRGEGDSSAFSYVYFDPEDTDASENPYLPYFHTELGRPLAAYYKKNGAYQRDFAKGKIIVNPTTQSANVPLEKEYVTLEGEKVSSVNMPAHTGLILTKPRD